MTAMIVLCLRRCYQAPARACCNLAGLFFACAQIADHDVHALCSSLYFAALTQTTWLAKVSQLCVVLNFLLSFVHNPGNLTALRQI
jgi:hypothetical protein